MTKCEVSKSDSILYHELAPRSKSFQLLVLGRLRPMLRQMESLQVTHLKKISKKLFAKKKKKMSCMIFRVLFSGPIIEDKGRNHSLENGSTAT